MKYVLITGVSTGIGFDLCRAMLEKGYYVIGSVRKIADKDRLETIWKNHFTAVVFDVKDQKSIEKTFVEVDHIIGDTNLFALVNNAGLAKSGPLVYLSNEDFEQQMDVNVNGIFRVTRTFFPLLKSKTSNIRDAGRIVNISSVSGLLNTPLLGAYCISKHAVESMSDIYRRELDVFGIKVIIIEPGPIKSQIWSKSMDQMKPYMNTEYAPYLKESNKMITNTEDKALDASYLSSIIIKALASKRPKLRYIVDKQKWIIYLVHHLLPARWLDSIVRKKLSDLK